MPRVPITVSTAGVGPGPGDRDSADTETQQLWEPEAPKTHESSLWVPERGHWAQRGGGPARREWVTGRGAASSLSSAASISAQAAELHF